MEKYNHGFFVMFHSLVMMASWMWARVDTNITKNGWQFKTVKDKNWLRICFFFILVSDWRLLQSDYVLLVSFKHTLQRLTLVLKLPAFNVWDWNCKITLCYTIDTCIVQRSENTTEKKCFNWLPQVKPDTTMDQTNHEFRSRTGTYLWYSKLFTRFYGGQPEAELVCKIVAGAPGPVALDERGGAEVLEARAGTRQGLTAALGARRRVLQTTTQHHVRSCAWYILPPLFRKRQCLLQAIFLSVWRHTPKITLDIWGETFSWIGDFLLPWQFLRNCES